MKVNFFHQQLQFSRAFKKALNKQLSEAGLFHSQWLVLYCIKKQQPVTLVEISNYLDVEKPTISRTIKRLEEQKLVESVPGADKRERRICLTETGENSYKKGQKIVFQFEKELAAEISDADMETTLNTILSLGKKLKKEEIN